MMTGRKEVTRLCMYKCTKGFLLCTVRHTYCCMLVI